MRPQKKQTQACKRRLQRTASGDCATPTERCNAGQDEAE
eukprot:CAMPEP_0177513590 /NCGR_PEP_ID=MMETSP0369-20130122/43853_1 /TAXON_ID=447022 ORGANISM="Scrippsiella hangoei-like, Strain SHHI-4" /NCGR_SAMPLE_ID=MMETSP0369 /ASSEMBLY_ACC=CAM_ASM_000364 /LENGTH=38 /DNA_ID= /DNA_START= /DNA_END= /DNA_ORIENTATION=